MVDVNDGIIQCCLKRFVKEYFVWILSLTKRKMAACSDKWIRFRMIKMNCPRVTSAGTRYFLFVRSEISDEGIFSRIIGIRSVYWPRTASDCRWRSSNEFSSFHLNSIFFTIINANRLFLYSSQNKFSYRWMSKRKFHTIRDRQESLVVLFSVVKLKCSHMIYFGNDKIGILFAEWFSVLQLGISHHLPTSKSSNNQKMTNI